MKSRAILGGLAALTVVISGCRQPAAPVAEARPAVAAAQPNFLFIAVDDLNHYTSFLLEQEGHFLAKVYPDPRMRREVAARLTPNLDRLARQSMVFTRSYCPQALCGPSRTALLSGIPPHVSGYYNHQEHFRQKPVLRDVVTLPQYLRANGYTAIGLGKIFHKASVEDQGRRQDWPDTDYSWDKWIGRYIGVGGPKGGKRTHSPYSPRDGLLQFGLNTTPADATWDFLNASFAAELYTTGRASLTDEDGVVHEVSLPRDRPFFLACGLFAPHLPWFIPQEFYDRFPAEDIQFDQELVDWIREDVKDLPAMALKRFIGNDFETLYALGEAHGEGPHGLRAAMQAYLAAVAFSDYCLGQLVDAIEQSPNRDNTVVVLWSDHGWHLGDKHRFRKQALWDPANHNVLMIRDPRAPASTAGARCDAIVGLQSLYPTLARRAGLAVPAHVHGFDLAPLLQDPQAAWDHPVLMTYGEGNHAVRTRHWRYIRYADGGRELYDMVNDPYEYVNLARDPLHRQDLETMDQLLERQLRQTAESYR